MHPFANRRRQLFLIIVALLFVAKMLLNFEGFELLELKTSRACGSRTPCFLLRGLALSMRVQLAKGGMLVAGAIMISPLMSHGRTPSLLSL